ncbi:tryptophan synthase subunit alpha [Patescibacteria group bacterium]|nr:tryptophan synthase subunit alpha [Patescibacteria group bacterium]
MNLIDLQIKKIKRNKQLGLMVHAVVGYPTQEKSEMLIRSLINRKVDFLELQIPFSDPIADGPTIVRASEKALKRGTNTDSVLELIGKLRGDIHIPVIIMAYYNSILSYGLVKFCRKAKKLNISGLIVPDMPPEEEDRERFIQTSFEYGLYPIRVVSPSSSKKRLEINTRYAKGFIYSVSHFGVTGSGVKIGNDLVGYINEVKKTVRLPIAVGFGIEKKEQVEKLNDIADIAVVGSAIIRNYEKGGLNRLKLFIKELKEGTIY